MKLRNKLILLGILVGVISCFGMNSSQASEITSAFSGDTITRTTVQNVELASENNTNLVPVTLGISKDRKSGNWYVWNPLTTAFDEKGNLKVDDNNNVQAQKAWKIAKHSSETSTTRDYSNLYYCLNAERGFGLTNGEMAEGAKDTYSVAYNMKDSNLKSTITNLAGGKLGQNYNKILWILDNSYIPTNNSNYQNSLEYKKLMGVAGIKIDEDGRLNLTEDDIEVVQQMAIWYFTNSETANYKNNELPSLYLNGNQLSSIYFYTTQYGEQITGNYRQKKAENLYKYFITNADANYTINTPTLTLSNTNVTVTESGDNYIVGPFSLSGTNTDLIKEISATLNVNATLLDSSKKAVTNNAFSKVIGKDFYLEIAKNSITSNKEITIKLTYKYDERNLTFLTDRNDPTNTQPVVLVEAKEKSASINTKANIELTSISVEKVWNDENNRDSKRPTSVKVQLYKDSKEYGNSITLNSTNNWKYTWDNLLDGYTYTVKELNKSGVKVENNQKYDNNYTAKYEMLVNKTTITNSYIPETTQISGMKTWDDKNNQDGKRPDKIIVNLLADGEIVNSKEVTVGNNWTYTFENLPKYKNGKEIVYTITEDKVENYTTTIEGYNIINSYNPETIEKTVTKNWNDANNQDGKRAEYGVTLKANGKTYGKEIVLNADTLTYTWRNLPKYENGKEIIYTVEETTIPDEYKATYSEDTFTITNTYTPGKISKKVIKVWNDEENKDELRPSNVNVTLYKTVDNVKTKIKSQLLNEENNWMYVWSELDKKENGKDIIYSVEETTVENYTTTYSSDNYQQTDEITITNTHIPIITGKYNVLLKKVDENGNILKGVKFEIDGTEYDLKDGEKILLENEQLTSTDSVTKIYNIKETVVPDGYEKIEDVEIRINATVVKDEESNAYKISRVSGKFDGENTHENITVTLEGNTIVITVKNTPIQKKMDLALRKFITQVNDIKYSREPIVDTSTISQTGTATYKHTKQPIAVQKGDVVTYTIRVYNEGKIDGYVEKITDYIPDHMTPIIIGTEGIDEHKYAKEIEFNLNWGWIISEDGKSVTTMKTSKINSDTYSLIEEYENITDTELEAYIDESDKLDYIDVQIKCLVTDNAVDGEYLTNIAEITDAQDINGVHSDGTDSKLANVDFSNLSDYKNEEALKSTADSYVPGQEDDDDFEKLVVKEFDLSLRKFITKVNETTYSREPVVDTSKLGTTVNGKIITTATYTHSKEPVIVETNDIVTYTIRIYNEGSIAGYANEITDDIPEGLEFLPDSDINVSYKWKMIDKDGNETTDVTKAEIITTDFLSDEDENNIINEVTQIDGVKTLSYKDVKVQFKVVAKAEKLKDNIIKNEAQISSDSDRDIDSTPNRAEKYDYTTGKNEDDIDYEPIKLQYFDLALRKFVTKVNNINYNNRYPEIEFNDDGSITYNHTKDPVLVETGDTVVYTIRVYNEGEKAGYATQIKDNLPEGLAFDPNNEINKLYGWKMIDKNGNETEETDKVVAFITNYLEKEIIDPLTKLYGSTVLSFRDVQIAFIVTETNSSDKILVNTAEISADSDDDIDSTPNNNVVSEDDIDKEYVKVEYFDLSLKKWVTETIVTLNGKTTTTKTGFTPDSDGIAKVDIVASKVNKTTVKFKYNIKVTNEGEVPGYAYEIKDYIPSGLTFEEEDNENWKVLKDNTIVTTDQLKNTLLNPGESATVEIVLTWKNSSTNFGRKTNYAEISEDSGDDIDSTPDNYDFTEDDMDDAQVLLSIKTARKTTYIGLILISITILAGGVYGIKKYVLK